MAAWCVQKKNHHCEQKSTTRTTAPLGQHKYVLHKRTELLYYSVNVNSTDATTGATALLLPAQNTHTLHSVRKTMTRFNGTQILVAKS